MAPAGAALAGVRLESGSNAYAGLAADNFVFTPEPGSAALLMLGAVGVSTLRRRRT
jgi:hypothetical protein